MVENKIMSSKKEIQKDAVFGPRVQKKFGPKWFWVQKYFPVQKKFGSKKSFGSKKNLGKKIRGPKKLRVKNIEGTKKFW